LKILITSIVDLKKSHIKLLEKAGPKMLQKPQESLHKTSSASAGQQTASIREIFIQKTRGYGIEY